MRDVLHILEFDKLLSLLAESAHTSYGKQKIEDLSPQFDLGFAQQEKEKAEEMFEFLNNRGSPPLQNIDIQNEVKKVKESRLSGIGLYKIARFLKMIDALRVFFSHSEAYVKEIERGLNPCYELCQEIEKAIDNEGRVKDDASTCLLNLRNKIRRFRSNANKKLVKLLEKSILHNVIVEKTVTIRDGRYTILVRPNFKQYLKGRIVDISHSGMSYFVEPELIHNENNELFRCNVEEEKETSRILLFLTNIMREERKKIVKNTELVAEIDIQVVKWLYAKRFSASFPEFVRENMVDFHNARHPLLLYKNEKETVATNIIIGKPYCTLIVTGPNTGGKTVFLKTIGLLVLMSYVALPIPISEGRIGEIKDIFASIGDEQSIEENLSTYSAKMKRMKEICEKADENSLLLLDEIGAGTDPKEGEVIAAAIIEYLKQKKCLNVVTTHSRNIIRRLKDIQTAAFLFDEEKLSPTYGLEYGRIGKSYALDIASLYLPHELVEKAKDEVSVDKTDELIKELELKLETLGAEKIALGEIKDQQREILLGTHKEREEKKREYENLIAEIKEKIKPLIKERALPAIHRELENINRQARSIFKEEEIQEKTAFGVGDNVKIAGIHTGKIVAVSKSYATVDYEGKIVSLPFSEIQKIKEMKTKQEKKIEVNLVKNDYTLEVNIIGKRRDEALIEVEKFIDSCILRDASTVRIVHGKGSGILKNAVREVLKNHPFIKDFRMGNPYEGGDGVTIAGLK